MNADKFAQEARRRFLKTAGVVAGLTVAPGVVLTQIAQAKPSAEKVTNKVRWGLLIDANKCGSGCDACVSACNDEHGLKGHDRPETDAQWIRKVTL